MLLNPAMFDSIFGGLKRLKLTLGDGTKCGVHMWSLPRRVVQTLFATIAGGLLLFLLLPSLRTRTPFRTYQQQRQAAKHLVIASYTAQNVSWLAGIPSEWTIKRYFMDDPNPDSPGLAVPLNQGREAMAYLTYLIDHYDALPAYMIFTHGHERSWHQMEPLPMKVRALNLTALDEEDYISLRCGDQMGCEKQPYIDTQHVNWSGEDHMCDFWETIVPREPCPRYVSYKCCAQHAVTRRAVRRRSKADWIRIRDPLMHDFRETPGLGDGATDWDSGMLFEKFWPLLLGAGPEELLNIYAEVRRKAGERHKKQQEAYDAQRSLQ
ncbi:hypothetical protein LTR48_006771 [Friedmanniomyces endolithicus]|nr:hypothetical protein LTR48_006771 [Friedmanniomyces endolithicus]